jgi:large subunit ribosomal protein L3
MVEGIIGKKIGMTQVFRDDGKAEAVTAIEAGPCTVAQVKTVDKEGYNAAQLGFSAVQKSKASRKGRARKKEPTRFKHLREFRLDDSGDIKVGQTVDISLFKAGDVVNVTGISKGKGFAGTVKRHHFRGGPPPRSGLYRRHDYTRAGVQGNAHGGTHGKPACNRTQSGGI